MGCTGTELAQPEMLPLGRVLSVIPSRAGAQLPRPLPTPFRPLASRRGQEQQKGGGNSGIEPQVSGTADLEKAGGWGGGLTQLLEAGVARQGQGQLLRALVVDLVVAEVQLLQGTVARQGPAEGGKGIVPRAQIVPLQSETAGKVGLRCAAPGSTLLPQGPEDRCSLRGLRQKGWSLMRNLELPTPCQRTTGQETTLLGCRMAPGPTPNHSWGAGGQGGGQDHTSPLDGLVLSEELSQSLSPCGLKVIALGQEEAGW